jgi:hypothetical protein
LFLILDGLRNGDVAVVSKRQSNKSHPIKRLITCFVISVIV